MSLCIPAGGVLFNQSAVRSTMRSAAACNEVHSSDLAFFDARPVTDRNEVQELVVRTTVIGVWRGPCLLEACSGRHAHLTPA